MQILNSFISLADSFIILVTWLYVLYGISDEYLLTAKHIARKALDKELRSLTGICVQTQMAKISLANVNKHVKRYLQFVLKHFV